MYTNQEGMHKIKNNLQVYTIQEDIEVIKNNRQVYTTQEGIDRSDKNNPQVYTTQEGIRVIKKTLRYTLPRRLCKRLKKPSSIHYPRGYSSDEE